MKTVDDVVDGLGCETLHRVSFCVGCLGITMNELLMGATCGRLRYTSRARSSLDVHAAKTFFERTSCDFKFQFPRSHWHTISQCHNHHPNSPIRQPVTSNLPNLDMSSLRHSKTQGHSICENNSKIVKTGLSDVGAVRLSHTVLNK